MDTPAVSVIMAVYNEQDSLHEVLLALEAQDYTGPLEIVVADGGSDDGTRHLLDSWSPGRADRVVLENPRRRQSFGLNLAAEAASGEILVRADGHTWYADDYVARSVEALCNSDAVAVGGPMLPAGNTRVGRAVAAAMQSRWGVGPGRFHHGQASAGPQVVDTVYLGAFRRSDFLAVGGYRAFPSGAGEDADLYYRWRRAGRIVLMDPAIRSTYRPRESTARLARQFWAYGVAKAELLFTNRELPSLRPLAPLALVVALASGLVLALAGRRRPLLTVGSAWAGVLRRAAGDAPPGTNGSEVAAAAALMHLAYGAGMAYALVRGPAAARPLPG